MKEETKILMLRTNNLESHPAAEQIKNMLSVAYKMGQQSGLLKTKYKEEEKKGDKGKGNL